MSRMSRAVRDEDALPAVLGILGGQPTLGLTEAEWPALFEGPRNCSLRDFDPREVSFQAELRTR